MVPQTKVTGSMCEESNYKDIHNHKTTIDTLEKILWQEKEVSVYRK
ncbi:MAG: hypothetical protein SCALA701_10820 [Candidatus Scalindua sp.]|nr:MAG: hypothetical protein SCALA701_10820 [Candidatus Scalindua sp.]